MVEGSVFQKVRAVAENAVDERKFEFVHFEIAGSKRSPVIRIFVDKPGGITIEDCSDVSRDIEAALDAEDIVPTRYVLEVSSPGIERGLYKLEDFVRFAGREAKIKTTSPVDGQSALTGVIESVEGTQITFNDNRLGKIVVDYSVVQKANLRIDLDKEFKGNNELRLD